VAAIALTIGVIIGYLIFKPKQDYDPAVASNKHTADSLAYLVQESVAQNDSLEDEISSRTTWIKEHPSIRTGPKTATTQIVLRDPDDAAYALHQFAKENAR
jgi:hypothetical protein